MRQGSHLSFKLAAGVYRSAVLAAALIAGRAGTKTGTNGWAGPREDELRRRFHPFISPPTEITSKPDRAIRTVATATCTLTEH